jgi:hypothetical protein
MSSNCGATRYLVTRPFLSAISTIERTNDPLREALPDDLESAINDNSICLSHCFRKDVIATATSIVWPFGIHHHRLCRALVMANTSRRAHSARQLLTAASAIWERGAA